MTTMNPMNRSEANAEPPLELLAARRGAMDPNTMTSSRDRPPDTRVGGPRKKRRPTAAGGESQKMSLGPDQHVRNSPVSDDRRSRGLYRRGETTWVRAERRLRTARPRSAVRSPSGHTQLRWPPALEGFA